MNEFKIVNGIYESRYISYDKAVQLQNDKTSVFYLGEIIK